jgi:hypothetical protein
LSGSIRDGVRGTAGSEDGEEGEYRAVDDAGGEGNVDNARVGEKVGKA